MYFDCNYNFLIKILCEQRKLSHKRKKQEVEKKKKKKLKMESIEVGKSVNIKRTDGKYIMFFFFVAFFLQYTHSNFNNLNGMLIFTAIIKRYNCNKCGGSKF